MNNKIFVKKADDFIRLDDLLKVSGEAVTGGQAKVLIQAGKVEVNGEICTMRGKKIYNGDMVTYKGIIYKIKAENLENTENRARKL